MAQPRQLHAAVLRAIIETLQADDNTLEPKDVLHYFESAAMGLRMTTAFAPSLREFIKLLELEKD